MDDCPDNEVRQVQTISYHSEGRMLPIVRVPNHGHEWIAWALDAGAAGVIVPHTETVEQARAAVRAARFAPLGERSFPPFVSKYPLTSPNRSARLLTDRQCWAA